MESSVRELAKYRYEMSGEAIKDAIIMYDNGRYKNALNRAYYLIFHAIRAMLAYTLLFAAIQTSCVNPACYAVRRHFVAYGLLMSFEQPSCHTQCSYMIESKLSSCLCIEYAANSNYSSKSS